MRIYIYLVLLALINTACTQNNINEEITISLNKDTTSVLRNPAMGWGVYDDANDEVQNAEEYWQIQDEAASKYASFFYIRWRWSDMEPEEGKYAWQYDENYKKLIQGAIDRGLKLCFRVYNNGQDNIRPGTPDFVRKAGAKGYTVEGFGKKHWTPYPDDPVFQEKLTNFVKAFAKEYDNPSLVDFIDGYSLGWWGECHHVKLQNPSALESVFDWFTTLYSSHFKNILLALPFGSQVGFETEKRIAIDNKGYAMRRDGLGSMWFTEKEKEIAQEMFGKTLLIGESCWWGCSTDDCRPFSTDTAYDLQSWRDVYELTFQQTIKYHFNTLDLRETIETKGWTTRAHDLVQQFISKGGYRFYPSNITIPTKLTTNQTITISHTWQNLATGYLPNNNPNWNYKYKPAFALINKDNEVYKIEIDNQAEPSEWLGSKEYDYKFEMELNDIAPGKYYWAVAIVDKTNNNTPGIKLAVRDNQTINDWVILTECNVD